MIKLSFVGDLMCQREQNQAVLEKYGKYYYRDCFSAVKPLLRNSDLVVGNLETPIAGKELGYTNHSIRFNTPVEFLEAIKETGINFLSIANNHCLDRGLVGLDRTIDALNTLKLEYSGAYTHETASQQIHVTTIQNVKIAFICCTYGTNSEFYGEVLERDQLWRVDLLKKQPSMIKKNTSLKHKIKTKIPSRVLSGISTFWHGSKIYTPQYIQDCVLIENLSTDDELYINKIKWKISTAKLLADLVIILPHMGGQYNPGPGEYTRQTMQWLVETGADLVVAGHSHTSHRCEIFKNNVFGAYSLGNFCFTPGVGWFIPHTFAEYGIILNIFIDPALKKIINVTFSTVKSVIDEDGIARTMPVQELYYKEMNSAIKESLLLDNETVINRFRGRGEHVSPQDEYHFPIKEKVVV